MDIRKKAEIISDLSIDFITVLWQHVSAESVNFSMKEHYLLEYIGQMGNVTMSEISKAFATAPTTMTSIVDRLVKKGYLVRKRSEEDRRIVLVTLGEKGKDFYKKHREESIKNIILLLQGLSEEEQDNLIKLVKTIKESLSPK